MSVSSCPSTAEIAAHVRERFSESIGAHLMECDSCMNLYERFFEERYGETIARIPPLHPDSSPATDDTVPDRIGVYEVRNLIGRGGMGAVFEAVHSELGKPVALKLIHSIDPHFLDRFQREKRIAGRFRHPNVVEATDAGTFRGKPYLVSELLNGSDLEKLVKAHGSLPWEQAVDIVTQAAKGLAHLNREGVVHRDIKPSNIFLTADGIVKILDVGLAKLVDDEVNDTLTTTGDILGSYDYIAPEQIKSVKRADQRSDIYSLGCTFYYLLTGVPPYSGKGYETKGEKIAAHLDTVEIPDVRALRPEIPAPIAKLVADMVAKAPERRPVSAGAILERLETFPLTTPGKPATTALFSRKAMVVGIVALLAFVTGTVIYFVHADKNRPSEVAPASEAVSEVQADPPKPVEPSTADSVALFHAKPVEADAVPIAETPPTTPPKPEPSAPEPPAIVSPAAADKSISPQQPKEWNPGVRRPSETITLIPSGKFDDDEEEE